MPTYPLTQDFRVIDVREGKTEPNPHGGQFQKFYVDFEDAPDTYWRRNAGDAPEIGRSYYGTVSKGEYGLRFKKEKLPDDFRRGTQHGSPGASQASSSPRGDSRNAEIRRQHSQQVAIEIMAARQPLTGATEDDAKAMLKEWADWFDQDAIAAGKKATEYEDPGASAHLPAPSSEFPDAKKDHDDFMALLHSKGITNPEAASIIADFYISLEPKRQLKLGNALMGDEYSTVLDALVAQTEAWANKKLPSLTSNLEQELDSELPF